MAIALVSPPLTPQRPAAYARISADTEAEGLGVKRQMRDCTELLERKGWPALTSDRMYVDNDISAARKAGKVAYRPEFERLLSDIAAGRVDAVVAWELDRLCRDPLEQEVFFLACERAGVHHVATIAEDVDIATGEGLLNARVKGAFAAEEVRRMAKKVKRKKLEIAEDGREHGGGPRRFGYEYDPATKVTTVVETEAAMLRDAADRILAGESTHAICREWNALGFTTVQGKQWRSTTLLDLLRSPRVAGLRQHQGAVIGDAVWQPILERGTWEQVGAVLAARGRKNTGRPASHLLSGGLLRCALCGTSMSSTSISGKTRYRCAPGPGLSGCGGITILAEPIEEHLVEAVLARLEAIRQLPAARRRKAQADPADADAEDAARDLASAEARQRELAEMWGAGEITRAEWVTARSRVEDAIAEARRRLIPPPPRPTDGIDDVRASWDDLGFERQRAILREYLDHVVVSPAQRGLRTFDPDRLEPVWRV